MTEGCKGRKCPCRMWVNCDNYMYKRRRAERLRRKEYDASEWYRDNFRADVQMIDIIVNG